jgi:hypothetical protein
MPKFIHDFLNDLVTDASLREQYDADSRVAMEEYGLTQDQQDIILDDDPQKIRDVLQMEMTTHVAYVIRMGSPGS